MSFGDPAASTFSVNATAGFQSRGYRFQINASNITVTHLGCYHPNTSSTTRTLVLFNFATQAVMAQVTSTAGTGWCWTALTTPITLTNGAQYIVSTHSDGSAAQGNGSYYFKSAPGGAWQPTGAIQYMEMRYNNGVGPTVFPTTVLSGYQYGVPDIGYSTGPTLNVTATAGAAQSLLATDTGPSNTGRSIGTFTINNTSTTTALTLNSITLTAPTSGSGNDSNAYSEVGLFDDSAGTTAGTWDAGDTRYGAASTAFPSDNGSIVFSATAAFAASQTRRYFVVVKMNGTTLATLGQTFNTQVTAMNVTGGTASGTPSTIMLGIIITAPTLTVTATAGTAQNVYANDLGTGGNGLNIGTFTISNGAVGPANLASITLKASGGGDDSTAFSEVGLFEDTNANSTYDPGTDTRYGTASTAYPANEGSITFTAAKAIAVSTSVRYFVIVKLNGSTPASPGHTFDSQVTGITTSGGASTAGTPSTVMNGLSILAPVFTFTDLALPAT
ncbi:MAG: DUF4082 domain-containing protein, partial [Planctomycetes bacterium]|nr:DUF4082 domain-containing protein [Planctomycetota bacterium]